MTEKLYYQDAYISEFVATVLLCEKTCDGYRILLDRTAFFPEEGGQSADTGHIGEASVLDVFEESGLVYHLTDKPLDIGEQVDCSLDFDTRFEKMQLHTAEHIVCGIIHSLYGYENVGFHLGDEIVTFDISAPMTREMLDRVEDMANRAVFRNLPIYTTFPSAAELSKISYRSKLDITEGVRIVTIEGVDACACCAPHVARTGEIGVIKLLDFEKHRGGCRIYLTAGVRALADYRRRYELTKAVSGYLSKPQMIIDLGVAELISERDALRREIALAEISRVKMLAATEEAVKDCKLFVIPDAQTEALREFCNEMSLKSDGYIAAISKNGDAYRYVLCKRDSDISDFVKKANAALCGKGGGRGCMATGNFSACLSDIESYFNMLSIKGFENA